MANQAARTAGLRSVAAFEAAKGLLVIAAGFGLLSLIHRDAQSIAESIVWHLRLNPARHYPRIFIEAAGKLNDSGLWLLAMAAFGYALVRLIEAYGLWRGRLWAEWFAILSGAFYLPFEIYELMRRVTLVRIALLAVNVAIVAIVSLIRIADRRKAP